MSLHHADGQVTLYAGDALADVLGADQYGYPHALGYHPPLIPDASVDAVVTDPPYGLEFMGAEWDRFAGKVSDRDFKGLVLSQQRTRNVKCPECARWAYDHPGRACECGGVRRAQGNAYQHWCEQWAAECLRVLKPGGHLLAFGGTRTVHRLTCAIEDAGAEIRDVIDWIYAQGMPKSHNLTGDWAGWGTGLKPAREPIVVARKPLSGTVAANMATHRTGAMNIAACLTPAAGGEGRWPTNLVFSHAATPDGVDLCVDGCVPGCPVGELDAQAGPRSSGANPTRRSAAKFQNTYDAFAGATEAPRRGADAGAASRFFPVFRYEPKAGRAERPRVDGVTHPTVKPLALMRFLVRLVAARGATVLDLFAGSGTTVEACLLEGMACVAAERETAYLPLIMARVGRDLQLTL